MYRAAMLAIEGLDKFDAIMLLAAASEWFGADRPGSLDEFKQWLADQAAQELIDQHSQLWLAWEAEPDKYSSPTIRKYIALIVPLEREAQKRGITKAALMAPIQGE